MTDTIRSSAAKPSDFSALHRRLIWHGMHFLTPLPGLFFMLGNASAGVAAFLLLCIASVVDPLLRLLLRGHALVRQLFAWTATIYLLAFLLSRLAPPLTLPFLVAALSVLLIWFSRRARAFERDVLCLEPMP